MTKVIITGNTQKVLTILPQYSKKRTIKKHHICINDIVDIEFTDGLRLMFLTLDGLIKSNIQILNLVLDKDISQETIDKKIMPKYIGKKENIKWI